MEQKASLLELGGSGGGVNKRRGYSYATSVKKLEGLLQEKVECLTALELEKARLLENESVLVDLVLQQENRLQHLRGLQAKREAAAQALSSVLEDTVLGETRPEAGTAEPASNQVHSNTSATAAVSVQGCQVKQNSSSYALNCYRNTEPQTTSTDSDGSRWTSETMSACPQQQPPIWQQAQQHWLKLVPQETHNMGGPKASQYCHHLLMNVTEEQWARAMSMTTKDWMDYISNLVMRLCLLMELLGRLESGTARAAAAAASAVANSSADDAAAAATSEATAAAKKDTMSEIDEVVDDFVTIMNISLLYNPMPVRGCACYNHITGELAEVVPISHWQQVNERLSLSHDQVYQLQLGYHQYWRLLGQVQRKQRQLVEAVNSTTSTADSRPSAAGADTSADVRRKEAAALAVAAEDRQLLQELLQQHMSGWTAAGGLLLQFYCNTLTRLQLARLLICSYPYLPRMGSLIGILLEPDDPVAAEAMQASAQQASQASRQQLQQLRGQHRRVKKAASDAVETAAGAAADTGPLLWSLWGTVRYQRQCA